MFRLLKKLLSLFRRKKNVAYFQPPQEMFTFYKVGIEPKPNYVSAADACAQADLEWLDCKYQQLAIKDKRFLNAVESDNKCKIDVLAYLKADAAYHKDYPGVYEKWAQENPEKIKEWREGMRCAQDEKPNG